MAAGKFLAHALIVDDEPGILEMLSERLRYEGYDCSACSSAEEAIPFIQRDGFDVILSDLCMQGMSGMDLLRTARQQCPRTAFILITGTQDVQIGIEAMKEGASDYVTKPFHLATVIRSVAQALEKKRLELEVEMYRQRLEQMVEQRTAQLRMALRHIEETYDSTLEALGAALDLRDSATEGHSARVTRYATITAKALGCPDDEIREIARGAYLHDIGKIGIPDNILLKEGKLTPEEQRIMKTHVMTGFQLVDRIPFLAVASQIVLAHQERFDGSGYPRGLKDGQIPLGARIFAVADTLDAMTSDRPYRKALPIETAIAEIRREAGSQFDPEVVRVFLSIPEASLREIQSGAPVPIWPGKAIPPESTLGPSAPAPPIFQQ